METSIDPVRFLCCHCGRMLVAQETQRGQAVACPICSQETPVPEVVPLSLPNMPSPDSWTEPPVHLFSVADVFVPPSMAVEQPPLTSTIIAPPPPDVPPTAAPELALPAPAAEETLPDLAELSALASSVPPANRPDPHMRERLFVILVVVPLISYAILATIAIVILYMRPTGTHPLEYLPDAEGDHKGAKQVKGKTVRIERVDPNCAIPAHLVQPLGKAVQLGDLEVVAESVTLQPIKLLTPGFAPVTSEEDALVLHLRLHNNSQDTAFYPTDPFFERRWKSDSRSAQPYSFVQIGEAKLVGGPLDWKPGIPSRERESVEGQRHDELQPGEALETLVCTDPEDHAGKLLTGFAGVIVWRVQLRRGLVSVGNRRISSTSVIGVRFRPEEIQRAPL